MHKKEDGFAGQISIVLPHEIKKRLKHNTVTRALYLTDIGYYPIAKGHFRERKKGATEHILIYAIEGKGCIYLQDKEFTLKGNEFFIIPSGVPHWYKADETTPWTIYWVHFEGPQSVFMTNIMERVIPLPPSKFARIKERLTLFDQIIEVLSLGFSPDNLEYANLCLHHLLASFKYIEQFRKLNYAGEKDIIRKSIIFMKQNLDKNFDLKTLATNVGISSSHYSKLFKQRTRHSPIDYFIQLKIQQACQMLNYSNMRIQEIANALGYNDAFYFSRLFKKTMGTSPHKYKKPDS